MRLPGINAALGEDPVEFPGSSLGTVLGDHVRGCDLPVSLDCPLVAVQKT